MLGKFVLFVNRKSLTGQGSTRGHPKWVWWDHLPGAIHESCGRGEDCEKKVVSKVRLILEGTKVIADKVRLRGKVFGEKNSASPQRGHEGSEKATFGEK